MRTPGTGSWLAVSGEPVVWEIADRPVPYPDATDRMEREAELIAAGKAPERVWLL
ncbi:MAG TPA: lipoate-protein ligase B, partial [Rhizobiales bacterium]|nr:lipoate-protein ligase B [Hyphomicrobiales bacterium]